MNASGCGWASPRASGRRWGWNGWAVLAVLAWSGHLRAAEPKTLAELVPPGTVIFAELEQPQRILELALDPELQKALGEIQGYRDALQSQQFRELRAVVAALEAKLGTSWQEGLAELTGGGMAVAFDPQTEGALLMVRSRNAGLLERLHATIMELIEQDARNKGRESPIRNHEYKGLKGWSFGPQEYHAILGDLLVVSNKAETLTQLADRYLGADNSSLAGTEEFRKARESVAAGSIGWGMVRMDIVRQIPGAQKVLGQKSENPGVELLFGGVLENLRHSPRVTAGLYLSEGRLGLKLQSPHDPAAVSTARAPFFPPTGDPGYLPLRPKGTLGTIFFYRDLGALWLAREQLLNEVAAAQLVQADNNLGQFFAGRDFGTQVLGELAPRHQLVVARQAYSPKLPVPEIKLPAFAMVWELKNPDQFGPVMLVAYQKILGIINIFGGMQGQPQLLLGTEDYHGVMISKAEYLAPAEANAPGRLNYNFSPACAQVGNRFLISSTVGLARDLVDAVKAAAASPRPQTAAAAVDSTVVQVEVPEVVALLHDNRESLVAQNMLQQGRSRREAENAIDGLLGALRLIQKSTLRLGVEGDKLVLEIAADLKF